MGEQPESLESKQFFLVVAVLESFGRIPIIYLLYSCHFCYFRGLLKLEPG